MLLIKFNLYSIIIMGGYNMKKFLKKVKRFILKNKLLSVLIGLLVLILIFGLVVIKIFIFPNYSSSKYGDRLEGIENVKLDDSRFNDIKNGFESKSGFTIEKFRLSGRIVNIYITAGDIKKDDVKSLALNLVNSFSEEEIKFYDFQVFVNGEGEDYPIIGYKNKNSEGLHWNNEGGN